MSVTREQLNQFRDTYGPKISRIVKDAGKQRAFHAVMNEKRGPKAESGSFEYYLDQAITTAVIHQTSKVSVVQRFSHTQPISACEAFVPTLNDRTPLVVHTARGESAILDLENPGAAELRVGSALADTNRRTVCFKVSEELIEDAVDFIAVCAFSAGGAFAKELDRIAFAGDQTKADGFVLGILNALRTSSIKQAASGHTSVATLDSADFSQTMGKLPEFKTPEKPRWFMSRSIYAESVLRLAGVNALLAAPPEDADGLLFGHKVHFIAGMPDATAAAGTPIAVFGHLNLGSIYAEYRDVSYTPIPDFDEDQVALKFKKFDDFVCWDRGTNDPADPAGSLVALQLAEA
ncbi:phage major capsid protein [Rhodopirellula sp. MGV]|uniref:phage major capsid protein n=1 Tax=Rhodopirellula sp. MGV TaxID=2023130 RepID=UPI000B967544|nr:phage major capsid protein [Rhodopirellula sp. MGV]OYP38897.1 phage major capsid protein [Rhodopirellula sp. MGV]PNY38289.1 phage major capsid protein [Rhodopirellula baltica]